MNSLAMQIQPKDIQLNEDQQKGFDTIVKFVEGPQRTLVLKGYAGTGKSTLIQEVASYFHGVKTFCFTAPTNKATKVLMTMSAQQNSGVQHISTIHSLLGLVMKPDGSVKTLSKGMRGMDDEVPYEVVVIDECSMVGLDLSRHIEEVLENNPHLKIIFMGDPMQLPPIGENMSATFDTSQVKVELTEVVRQAADNPIIQLCTQIRESIIHKKTLYDLKTVRGPNQTGIHVLPRSKFNDWIRKAYASDAYKLDQNSFKTIAWRNIAVNKSNNMIRRAIYRPAENGLIPKFMLEERVVVASPVTDMMGDEILAHTDSEGLVISSHVIPAHPWVKAHGEFKVYHLVVDFYGIGEVECFVLHEEAEKSFKKKLNQLSDEARKEPRLWGTFHSFKDSFHDVRYAHAITSHRSQGSTYQNVFVQHGDIMLNRDKVESFKSFYVAASRASKNLMILD